MYKLKDAENLWIILCHLRESLSKKNVNKKEIIFPIFVSAATLLKNNY